MDLPASLSHLCRVTLLWPFKHPSASVIVLAATPPPRPRFPAGTSLSLPLAALHRPSLLGPPTPAILYRLEIAKHLSAIAILLQLLTHRRPDRFGYLA